MPDLNILFGSKKLIKSVRGRVRTFAKKFGSFLCVSGIRRSVMHWGFRDRTVMHWSVMHSREMHRREMHWSLRDRSARDCAVMHGSSMH